MTLQLVQSEDQGASGGSEDPLCEWEAALRIVECLEENAARMPSDSPVRALALRSANRWRLIGATRPIRNGGPANDPRCPKWDS